MSILDEPIHTLRGEETSLSSFGGKAILAVNVASKCGLTPQYTGLEALQEKYSDKGFTVVGFPCNQFGAQEPGDEKAIEQFCELNYGVTFPMFAKVDVNGDDASPLFKHLKSAKKGILGSEAIKWNFTKFLVDRDGNVVERYAPKTEPKELENDVRTLL